MASHAPRETSRAWRPVLPGVGDILRRPLPVHEFLGVSAVLVACMTAYCMIYCLVAFTPMHGALMPVHISAAWAFSAVAPWAICFELVKREQALPPAPQAAAILATFLCCGLLSIALGLGFSQLLGGTDPVHWQMELAHLFPRVAVTALLAAIARNIPAERQDDDSEGSASQSGLLERAADIEWIKAAGNYVEVRMGGRTMLHRVTMRSLEASLDPTRFVRIHRQAIVNRDFVDRQIDCAGSGALRLKDGTTFRIGARYEGNWSASH